MAARPEIAFPQLTLETAKVFIAEDDDSKLQDILKSLGTVGLDRCVEIATTYTEAEEYVEAQIPGQLTANIFLFDGNLDSSTPNVMWHGSALAAALYRKYRDPLSAINDRATAFFLEEGFTQEQVQEIVTSLPTDALAANRLTSEALLVGISRVDKGELGYPAQIPRADYQKVGGKILGALPSEIRNNLLRK